MAQKFEISRTNSKNNKKKKTEKKEKNYIMLILLIFLSFIIMLIAIFIALKLRENNCNKNIENLQNNPGADLTKNYENKGKKDIELNGEIIINSQSENNEVKNNIIDNESCISFDNINIDGENSISNNNKIKNKINLNNNIIEEDNNNKNKEVNNINNNKEGLEIKMDIINKELKDELNPESSIKIYIKKYKNKK